MCLFCPIPIFLTCCDQKHRFFTGLTRILYLNGLNLLLLRLSASVSLLCGLIHNSLSSARTRHLHQLTSYQLEL